MSLLSGRRGLWRLPAIIMIGALVLGGPLLDQAEAKTKAQRIERHLTNQERKIYPGTKLRLDRHLSKIARRHSRRMANSGVLHHNPNLAGAVRNRNWRVVGENVAVGPQTGSLRKTLGMLHDAFVKSRPHRRNMRDERYRLMGFGLVRSNGRVWVTVMFMG